MENNIWYIIGAVTANLVTITIPIMIWAWQLSATLAQLKESDKRQNELIQELARTKQGKEVCNERHKD